MPAYIEEKRKERKRKKEEKKKQLSILPSPAQYFENGQGNTKVNTSDIQVVAKAL